MGPYVDNLCICARCAGTVHFQCSTSCEECEDANLSSTTMPSSMRRICHTCVSQSVRLKTLYTGSSHSELLQIMWRLEKNSVEYPQSVRHSLLQIKKMRYTDQSIAIKQVQNIMYIFHHPLNTLRLQRACVKSKGGVFGVYALQSIPRYTHVGIYPGYTDIFATEQCYRGRKPPKYTLLGLNCADYNNQVFPEFESTFLPYLNEPSPGESANCAWIQEHNVAEGRLSVLTVKNVSKGDELLVGYGPLYDRLYPFEYDSYSFHKTETMLSGNYFVLGHSTCAEAESNVVGYVLWDAATREYSEVKIAEF